MDSNGGSGSMPLDDSDQHEIYVRGQETADETVMINEPQVIEPDVDRPQEKIEPPDLTQTQEVQEPQSQIDDPVQQFSTNPYGFDTEVTSDHESKPVAVSAAYPWSQQVDGTTFQRPSYSTPSAENSYNIQSSVAAPASYSPIGTSQTTNFAQPATAAEYAYQPYQQMPTMQPSFADGYSFLDETYDQASTGDGLFGNLNMRIVFIILGILILLSGGILLIDKPGSNLTSKGTSTTSSQNSDEDQNNSITEDVNLELGTYMPHTESKAGRIGEQLTASDGFVMKVIKIDRNYKPKTTDSAPKSGELVRVSMIIGNADESGPKSIKSSEFQLFNSAGSEIGQSLADIEFEGNVKGSITLSPGSKAGLSVLFEIPESAEGLNLARVIAFESPSGNVLSSLAVHIID